MNARFLAVSFAALLISQAAHATTYFDTVNVPNNMYGSDGPVSADVTMMADSFTAGTPNFSSVSLLLAADNPSDGGSAMVYLVPDDGSGGANGVAGAPTATFSNTGQFTSFSGAQLLGTILDSQLPTLSSNGSDLVTLSVSPTVTTLDHEYWIALVPDDSSAEWFYSDNDSGIGTANQSSYYGLTYASGGFSNADSDVEYGGPNDLIVATPEPATFIILGSALAALGLVQRRKVKKA